MSKIARKKTFQNTTECRQWLNKAGFSYGPTCRGLPVAVMWGKEWFIAKWRNLSAAEIAANHASYDYSDPDGPTDFELYETAPKEALEAFDADHAGVSA